MKHTKHTQHIYTPDPITGEFKITNNRSYRRWSGGPNNDLTGPFQWIELHRDDFAIVATLFDIPTVP